MKRWLAPINRVREVLHPLECTTSTLTCIYIPTFSYSSSFTSFSISS